VWGAPAPRLFRIGKTILLSARLRGFSARLPGPGRGPRGYYLPSY
jgi:hypothetical protein